MMKIILYSIFTLFMDSCSSRLNNDFFLIITISSIVGIYFLKGCDFNKEVFYVLIAWSFINIFSYFINGADTFSIASFGAVTMRMLMPYFIMKIIGNDFFDGLQNYLFILCVISFPFFIIESINPEYVQSLAPSLNFMTMDEQKTKGGFYIFFYMHSGWAQHYDWTVRNCGFMWEPGAFSMILSFMIVYQLYRDDFKLTFKTIFLIICMLSTYSTSGFMALFSIIILYFFYNKSFYKKFSYLIPLIIIPVIIIGYNFYKSSEFMEQKIERYIEQSDNTSKWKFKDSRMIRVNRVGFAIIAAESSLVNPIGNGITDSSYIVKKYKNAQGPNSYATILIQWGWLGVIVLIYCLYNFRIKGKKGRFLLLLPVSLCLFSNPFSFKYLIYAIIFAVLCQLCDNQEPIEQNKEEILI